MRALASLLDSGRFSTHYSRRISSTVLVDPLTPRLEVVGPTLFGDGSERPSRDLVLVFHRNGHDPNLVRVRALPPEFEVATRPPCSSKPVFRQGRGYLPPGEPLPTPFIA